MTFGNAYRDAPADMRPDRGNAGPPDADLHELLTVDEVAALLKVRRSWVYEHTRSRGSRLDRVPHIKVGKYVRFEPRAVRAFLERKCRVT